MEQQKNFPMVHSSSHLEEIFEYQLLDSGCGRKLERLGSNYVIIRPSSQAIWSPRLSEKKWLIADAEFRHAKGKPYGGKWTFRATPPEQGWTVQLGNLRFQLNLTNFGHVGLFPEQEENWIWLDDKIGRFDDLNVLNIFGYTGVSTLISALRGARVTHVDASKPTIAWARENQRLSGLQDYPIRWIVDDAVKFLKREERRGNQYQAIIMDPPSFGRGLKGEVWKLENHFPELLALCRKILAPEIALILLTSHSPGFSALTLKNLLRTYLNDSQTGNLESGEMFVRNSTSGIHLPNGFFSRWSKK